MKKFVYIAISFVSIQSAFAFHKVTDLTVSNKLIISKDLDQKRVSDKAPSFYTKSEERKIPQIGDKVKIFRTITKYNDSNERLIKSSKKELIGTATIVSPELSGDTRLVAYDSGSENSRVEFSEKSFTEDEVKKMKTNSLVAKPDGDFKVKLSDTVEY